MTTKTRSNNATQKKSQSNREPSKLQATKGSNGKKQKILEELLEDNLKDVYSVEIQMIEALPEMAEAAHNVELERAFNKHLEETKKQLERLEKVFEKFEIDVDEVEICEAMKGLIEENKIIVEEYEESHVRDSALIIGAQKIEHYEIASYGSLCELADVLGYSNLHDLLGRSLDEEETTDAELTEIAVAINDEAKEMSEGGMEHEDEDFS